MKLEEEKENKEAEEITPPPLPCESSEKPATRKGPQPAVRAPDLGLPVSGAVNNQRPWFSAATTIPDPSPPVCMVLLEPPWWTQTPGLSAFQGRLCPEAKQELLTKQESVLFILGVFSVSGHCLARNSYSVNNHC